MDTYGLLLNNTEDYTRAEGNLKSIIDLTLSSIDMGPLDFQGIDYENPTPSDHEVIYFSWEDLETSKGG